MTKIMANVLVESESVKSLLTDAQFSHLNTCEYFIYQCVRAQRIKNAGISERYFKQNARNYH